MKKSKLDNLMNAFSQLKNFGAIKNPSDVEIAGIIQAFEFTFECLWKALKSKLEDEGLPVTSPKSAFQQAYKSALLTEEKVWLQMLEDRNLVVHTYNKDLADKIYRNITISVGLKSL